MVRTIIFDFDGVIVDSVPLKTEAFVALYPQASEIQQHYIRQYQLRHGGISRLHKIAHYETYLGRPPLSAEALVEKAATYGRLVEQAVSTCPLIEGAAEYLSEYCERYRLHLVSGTPDAELRRIVEARGLTAYFKTITGSPPGKQETFARILASDGVRPDEALAVGDSITEYAAANALGIPFVGVVSPREPNPFPSDVSTVPDMRTFAAALASARQPHARAE